MSDVKMSLTQNQYCAIMRVLETIPRILDVDQGASPPHPSSGQVRDPENSDVVASTPPDLSPELQSLASPEKGSSRVFLEFVFTVDTVRLQLYNAEAKHESDFNNTGIARFVLSEGTVRAKSLADGGTEAEIILRSFTMTNTCPGSSRFKEIIPLQKNRTQAQVMVMYSTSGTGGNQSAFVIVTIDSPKVLFALDPVFALFAFFTSGFSNSSPEPSHPRETDPEEHPGFSSVSQSRLGFRVDLHDVSLTLLENDEDLNSRAITLSIKQILMSQQVGGFPCSDELAWTT